MTQEPLHIRLYCCPHDAACARLIGYDGLSEIVLWERYKELCAEYGQLKMAAAVTEMVTLDKSTTPVTVRLTPEVRRHGAQLCGVPPERMAEYNPRPLRLDALPEPTEPQPKPRTRRK